MALYLALGDSITAGYGVRNPFSFPNIYANSLMRHNPDLRLLNLGVNGLTTSGLLNLLKSNPRIRKCISQASLITLTIGSNDLLRLIRSPNQPVQTSLLPVILGNMNKTLLQIGQKIRLLNPSATVKVATIYNPLPAGPYAGYSLQAQRIIDNANGMIMMCARRYGFTVVDLDPEMKGKESMFIGRDYAHPSIAGYQMIAKAFARH
ncbi:lysophospholipase L1-like esterase [Desulfosporosinus orientis DSM 765]|uniref:Lysophospholipase L1-like esterase n=1 Tax=Desulfosporosinus orientis (strain ATCC 19365 / DSM 765 / NCIMB 8382 / VKM B-1628 / Singapore I) TaxID=768706 RepID=G7W8F1_DESOD|nr:SGNH/GDSL hydrolase family protein [Desulfosporosinus orientis]AET67091.1 lysophospholipase L1-like esterase [Desulfosporosinus orientis DSM 765]